MKSKIREKMKLKRKAIPEKEVIEKSIFAQEIFLKSPIYKNASAVMIYIPLGNEMKTDVIMENTFFDGKTVLVPITDGETFEISAHKISRDTEFSKGVFSLTEPKEKCPFEVSNIDVVIVPGVAFSKSGKRIGFGKGCYDKFLKETHAVKVGFCYDFQLTDNILTDEFDVKMDYIITEKKFINCKAEPEI